MERLTRKAQAGVLITVAAVSAAIGVAGNHFAPKHNVAQPTPVPVKVVIVTPTSSPSAIPTVFVSPTKALYKAIIVTPVQRVVAPVK